MSVCKECPNKLYCLVFYKYGEQHTKIDCINMSHYLRYGIPLEREYNTYRRNL